MSGNNSILSDANVYQSIGQAIWDPKPTETDDRAKQLAIALGYPIGWRVVRTLEFVKLPASREPPLPPTKSVDVQQKNNEQSIQPVVADKSQSASSDETEQVKDERDGQTNETKSFGNDQAGAGEANALDPNGIKEGEKGLQPADSRGDEASAQVIATNDESYEKLDEGQPNESEPCPLTQSANVSNDIPQPDAATMTESSNAPVDELPKTAAVTTTIATSSTGPGTEKCDSLDSTDVDHPKADAVPKEPHEESIIKPHLATVAEGGQVKTAIDDDTAAENETNQTDSTKASDLAAGASAASSDPSEESSRSKNEHENEQTTTESYMESKKNHEAEGQNKPVDVAPAGAESVDFEPTKSALPAPNKNDAASKADDHEDPLVLSRTVQCVVDRIYSGKPGSGCDMWYHHSAAMEAAAVAFAKLAAADADNSTDAASTIDSATSISRASASMMYDFNGGHMLARQPLYSKGDRVQVYYEDDWWNARILKRKESKATGFRYQVQYAADQSKQSSVDEELIRWPPEDKKATVSDEGPDPYTAAAEMGFGQGWQAVEYISSGKRRWKITAPDGTAFKSKKDALHAFRIELVGDQEDSLMSDGDPPWRTTGNSYLGRRVVWMTQYKASATRTAAIEQLGSVVGWISETDVDKDGKPGFISEKTGVPARLYHVRFDDMPKHRYATHLVQSQDLEEYELLDCLLDEESAPPTKKARKR